MSASDDNLGTSYPRGGTSTASGGLGIFVDPETEDPLEIWVDLAIPNRMGLIRQLQVSGSFVGCDARSQVVDVSRHHRHRDANPARPQASCG